MQIFFITFCLFVKIISEWHQYDGIMLKNPGSGVLTGAVEKFKSWFTRSVIDRKAAAYAMLPPWSDLRETDGDEQRRGELFIEKIDQVIFCVRNWFINEDATSNESGFREVKRLLMYLCSI